jgi:hypothetical protein
VQEGGSNPKPAQRFTKARELAVDLWRIRTGCVTAAALGLI